MTTIYNIKKLKGFFKVPTGGTQGISCAFSYSAASYTDADPDPTPTITGTSGGTFTSTAGIVINADTGEIDLSASAVNTYVITYTVRGKACTQSVEITASFANTYSFNFDGVDDYINTGSSSQDGAGALTISAWFNTSYNNWQYFFGDNGFRIFLKQSIDRVDFTFNGSVDWRSTSFAITLGDWNHIAVVFDGSLIQANRLKIYLNNSLISNTLSGTSDTTFVANNNFMLGRVGTTSTQEWNGNLDEISVYNTAKDASAISTLYNSGEPGNLASLSPVNWWRMGDNAAWDGSNWTLTDQGSGSDNGTSANMVEADRETDVPT